MLHSRSSRGEPVNYDPYELHEFFLLVYPSLSQSYWPLCYLPAYPGVLLPQCNYIYQLPHIKISKVYPPCTSLYICTMEYYGWSLKISLSEGSQSQRTTSFYPWSMKASSLFSFDYFLSLNALPCYLHNWFLLVILISAEKSPPKRPSLDYLK